jgi:hypothetical protein
MDGFMPQPGTEQPVMSLSPVNPAQRNIAAGATGEAPFVAQMPDGSYASVPTVWYDGEGKPQKMSPEEAFKTALEYEKSANRLFPRFATQAEATAGAARRAADPQADRPDVPNENAKGTMTEQEIATVEEVVSSGDLGKISRLEQEIDRKYGRGIFQRMLTNLSRATGRAKQNAADNEAR